jgi:hypothetical protein
VALEQRGKKVYYYRSRRVGDRVKHEYVCRDSTAEMVAQRDAAERERRRAAVLQHRARVAALKAQNAEFASELATIDAAVADALRAHGWHRQCRHWRKRKTEAKTMGTELATLEEMSGLSWVADDLWKQAGEVDMAALDKAQKGDRAAARAVDQFLSAPPGRALFGDVGRRAMERWADLCAGDNRAIRRAVIRFAADLRAKLAGKNPTALDLILAERVVLAWLFASWADCQLAAVTEQVTVGELEIYLKRSEMGSRVLLAACRTLAKVRRAKLPEVLAFVNVSPPSASAKPARRIVMKS